MVASRLTTIEPRRCRRSEEHTSELQSQSNLVCRLLLDTKYQSLPSFSSRLRWPYHFFVFNDTATTEIYTLSLHDALPISASGRRPRSGPGPKRLLPPGPETPGPGL